jgi:transcriptional regulator with XRE-family HTH domain
MMASKVTYPKPEFGQRLRAARQNAKFTIYRLSALAKVSRRTIHDIELGANISVVLLERLMLAMGLTSMDISERISVRAAADPHAPTRAMIDAAAEEVERGVIFVQNAASMLRGMAGESTAAEGPAGESSEKVTSLINSFSAIVRSVSNPKALGEVEDAVNLLAKKQSAAAAARPVRRRRKKNA